MFDGHDETHSPSDASWLFAHVRQNVDDPAQVLQDESQAGMTRQQMSGAQ